MSSLGFLSIAKVLNVPRGTWANDSLGEKSTWAKPDSLRIASLSVIVASRLVVSRILA
jgi:hypothetical protein